MYVSLICKTWLKDTYGLFDYDCKDHNKQKLSLMHHGFIFREEDNVKFIEEHPSKKYNDGNYEVLCEIECCKG